MKSQTIAKVYAKSIVELSEGSVDIAKELTDLNILINNSNNLENVLFSEVFTIEEKSDILNTIVNKLELSELVKRFLVFLLDEKRFNIFPLIYKEVIVLDDNKRGFLRGVLEGAEASIDPSIKEKLSSYLKDRLNKKTELNYKQSSEITAGYRMTVDDLQLDASLENQLEQFKHSVLTFE
jgi:F-type H+-transporting ATPase subunit delta